MSTYAIFGAGGGLGLALTQELRKRAPDATIHAFSRSARPDTLSSDNNLQWHQCSDDILETVTKAVHQWQADGIELNGVISTIGWLHQVHPEHGEWQPERRIEQLNGEQLQAYFYVNATLPALLLQACKPALPKKEPCFFAQLGAKVGSIGDNELGGWYGYRASKAALNMLFKTASIEFKRTHKKLILSVIHPGTTDTKLSEPFQERLPKDKLFSAETSAERIWDVIEGLTPEQSGGFWFWDGKALPW